ncbi:MAG: PLDc_N domain-containing protein [Alphaproteobacteria bacterium]|nr:PLDc_N domain-containing protein [Alphaproteobacteria bacterium]
MSLELQFGGGLLGLLYLALLLWVLYHIVQSERSFLAKMIWMAAVFVFSVLGWLAWLLFGPRARR